MHALRRQKHEGQVTMDNHFARGARVRKPPDEKPLTMAEASFVVCSVAQQNGFHSEEIFLGYMQKAWRVFNRASSSASAPQSEE